MKSKFYVLLFTVLFAVAVNAQVSVTATAGTTGPTPYTTLKGAFDAINAGTHQGVVTIVLSGSTTETATASLNASGAGSAVYTNINISATAPVTITGSIVGAIIKLTGADNVTIDGRIGGTGRNITVQNTSTATATAAIWLTSTGAGAGATNNIIRNLEIACGVTQNTSTNTTFGIIQASNNTTISATGNSDDSDNNAFIANRIIRCRYGIVTRGNTTNFALNTIVRDNIIGPTSFGADQIGKAGIFMQADQGAIISGNTVQFVGGDFANTTSGGDRVGIGIGAESWSTITPTPLASNTYTVTNNIIHDIIEERTFSALGIVSATTDVGPTNNLIANNFIYHVRANGTAGDQTVGIAIAGGNNDKVVFNSIYLFGDVDPGTASATSMFGSGIRIGVASSATHANLTLMNNAIHMNLTSSSTATARYYAISGSSAAYSFGTGGENFNDYYLTPGNTQLQTGGLGTATGNALTTQFATLANWQTAYAVPQDANSIQLDPSFVSTSDLHISPSSSTLNALATPIAGVTTDIDGNIRNVTTPDIGADEFTPPACVVTCPANVTVSNTPGLCSAIVTYPAPVVSGPCGIVATIPASGAIFPVGATTVNGYSNGCATIYAVDLANNLINFSPATPATTATVAITGLVAGDIIVGIDFRPANNQLYGMGLNLGGTPTGRLYTINTTTGAATAVGASFTVPGPPNFFHGFDFNPVVDRIRVVGSLGQNFRLNPNNAAIAGVDTDINPPGGLQSSAYTNNFPGAPQTTLYAIDDINDVLVIQGSINGTPLSPNSGTITPVGPLGVVSTFTTNLDISQCDGTAYATMVVGGITGLYTINLATGAATLVGTVGGGATALNGIAIAPASSGTLSCSFTVTVNDTQNPVITCPANITIDAALGTCSAVVTYTTPTATDNCAGVTVARTAGPASGSAFPGGVTTVTHTATDASGNTATCSFTVTVNDITPPTIVCPPNVTVSNTPGLCTGTATFGIPVIADNCAAPVSNFSQTWTQTGQRGAFFDVRNIGTSPIVVTSINPAMWGAAALNDVFTVYFTTSATTYLGNETNAAAWTLNSTANVSFPGGPNPVQVSVPLVTPLTLAPGQSRGVYIVGTQSFGGGPVAYLSSTGTPAYTGPQSYQDASLQFSGGVGSSGLFTGIFGTGLPGNIRLFYGSVSYAPGYTQTTGLPSGSAFPVGTTTNTLVATDAAGNTASCTFTVTVNDTQAPTVSCPANVTRATDAGVCTATFTPNTPTAADNCAVTVQTWALTGATTGTSPATGINTIGSRAFNIGVTTVTYTVRDAAGNTNSCSFTITVTDAVLPVISTPPVNRSVCVGATATFSVVSSNAVTYQWQQFIGGVWTNITGANAASFSVPNTVQSMNTNTFRVNVTGPCGTVSSAAATLFVNPLPTISLTSSNPAVLLPGQTTSIVANVNPTGGTFAWFKNGQPRTPTVTTGTLSNLGVDDAGVYHAVYTDLNGCIATSASIVINAEPSDLFFVAPNPNFGQFWVRYYNPLNEPLTVIVYDSKGAKVHEQTSATTQPYTQINVNMKVKSGGIYLVELRGADGRRLGAKRIIVGVQ